MTAINTIIQGNAVHVVCDSAAYDADGRLVSIVPKIAMLPHVNACSACRGPRVSVSLFADLLSSCASSFDELKSKAPAFLRELQDGLLKTLFANCEFGGDYDLVVVGISESAGPDAWLVCNHERYGVEPWTAVQFAGLSMMPADPPMQERVFASIPDDIELIDPERDGLTILQAQRAHAMDHGGGRKFVGVGGVAQCVSIARDGTITSKILHRWDDTIGQTIGATDILAAVKMFGVAA